MVGVTLTISLNQLMLRVLFQLSLYNECYQAKYQESTVGFENLAYLQSIEKRCNFLIIFFFLEEVHSSIRKDACVNKTVSDLIFKMHMHRESALHIQ